METIRLPLWNAQQAHQTLRQVWAAIKPHLLAEAKLHLEVRGEKRSDPQNRRMWAMLGDIARQVEWHGQKLAPEDWKDMATAALKKQRVVPGLDGAFVVLGQRTSKMSKADMGELIDFLEAFGAQRGVRFSAPEQE